MGSNQYDRYYLDDDWYQDIKLDANIPITSGEDLLSPSSNHGPQNHKDKSQKSKLYNNPSSTTGYSQSSNGNQRNNGNVMILQKSTIQDSNDAKIDLLSRDDNDNRDLYPIDTSLLNEVIFGSSHRFLLTSTCYFKLMKGEVHHNF